MMTTEIDSSLQLEVAQLIVDTLHLDDVDPAGIDPQAPLFGEGLGLDSIDALELALAISRNYGFQLWADAPENVVIFSCLRELARHIAAQRSR